MKRKAGSGGNERDGTGRAAVFPEFYRHDGAGRGAELGGFFQWQERIEEIVPAMCRLDYAMSEAGGASEFVRAYTLAGGGPYCDCGYKKKVRT